MKHGLSFILFLLTFSFISLLPIIQSPTYAEIREECKDMYLNNFYCHCQGNKIVCPDVNPWNPIPQCLPYKDKVDCAATNQICTDHRTTDDDDMTAKDAKCVVDPNKTATAACTCDNPDDPNPRQNGKKCLVDGKQTQTYCATNELCTGAGQCKAMDCTCDKNDEKKVVCSTTGASGTGKSLTCPSSMVCGGTPGQAKCVDKAANEVGKCTCDGNKIKCEKGSLPDCDTNSKCVADPSTAIGVKCEDTGDALPEVKTIPTLQQPPPPPCGTDISQAGCSSITTALGEFSTSPSQFITRIFGILLSVSGGIALLLIIRAGYKIMTSQGKPDAIQQGRDEMVAAIVGLMFLVFSFVILQVIGVDILKIPEFGGTNSSQGGSGSSSSGPIPQNGSCNPNSNNCASGLTCVYVGGSSTGQCKPK